MNRLLRYWNQNKRKILLTIGIIVFSIVIIQILNTWAKNSKPTTTSKTTIRIKDNERPNQSVITGEKLSEEIATSNSDTIKQFVNYCNNKEVEKAFSLLSKDCKKEFNNSIETFKLKYCNDIFKTKKTYKLDLLLRDLEKYTYTILYYDDNLLATGGKSMNNNIEDYITIIKENNENKINIKGFIEKEIINKSTTVNDIEILVNSKKVYRDYETYNITIRNYTSNSITISDGETEEDIYLLDKNNAEYLAFTEEIPEHDLTINAKKELTLDLNFNKSYSTNRNIEKVEFSNINLGNKGNQRIKITVEL